MRRSRLAVARRRSFDPDQRAQRIAAALDDHRGEAVEGAAEAGVETDRMREVQTPGRREQLGLVPLPAAPTDQQRVAIDDAPVPDAAMIDEMDARLFRAVGRGG